MTIYETFAALHRASSPLILTTVWDAGSARAAAEAGAPALGTSSWAVAAARGAEDGELLPPADALGSLADIVAAVEVPVSVDLERGYGATPDDVAVTCRRAADLGAVGCNLEDSLPGGALRPAGEGAARVAACRRGAGRDFWINARTDVFFRGLPLTRELADEAVARARAYAEAGASSLFAPGLTDPATVADLVARAGLPVTVMVTDLDADLAQLAAAGVARISRGPAPYLAAMAALARSVRE